MSTETPSVAAPPVELVDFQIDGVWHKVPKGTRIIEACQQAAIDVPHYCYHPKLTSPGNCRMCLVQSSLPPPRGGELPKDDAGMPVLSFGPRPIIACANSVSQGGGVLTNSTLVEEYRRGVMEFLLINHPLDCPICDQAGECKLQEYSVEHGNGQSRFREDKVKKPKNEDIGPRVRLDDERCIMCSRCIRFCSEVVDDPVLGFTERGSHTVLTAHEGQRLENNYSLNTVDICPVGALTNNDFRFQMRVWFLKETNTICTGCGRGCNLITAVREDKIYRQTPRENNEVNSHWLCDQGRLDFHYVNSERRLAQPMARVGGAHQFVSWASAVQMTAEALKKAAGSTAFILSGRMTNEEFYLAHLLAKALGVTQVDIVPRTGGGDNFLRANDLNPNSLGFKTIFKTEPGAQLPAIVAGIDGGGIKTLLVWGENLLKSNESRQEDLAKLDFIVSSHILANPFADASTVVFPTYAALEKRGSMINVTGRLQRLQKTVDAPGDAKDDWEVLQDLLNAVTGSSVASFSLADVYKRMAADFAEFPVQSWALIGDQGVPMVETEEKIPLLERERERIKQGLIVG